MQGNFPQRSLAQKQLKQHHQPPPVPVVVEPPPKETSNTSAKKGNAINRVFGGFAQVAKTPPSKAARKDIKNHDSNEDDDADDHDQGQKKATAILKRSDGRPILVCRIPLRYLSNKSIYEKIESIRVIFTVECTRSSHCSKYPL